MNDGHFFLSHKTLPDIYGAHKTSLEVSVLSVLRVKGATYRERDEGEIFRNPAVVYGEGVFRFFCCEGGSRPCWRVLRPLKRCGWKGEGGSAATIPGIKLSSNL